MFGHESWKRVSPFSTVESTIAWAEGQIWCRVSGHQIRRTGEAQLERVYPGLSLRICCHVILIGVETRQAELWEQNQADIQQTTGPKVIVAEYDLFVASALKALSSALASPSPLFPPVKRSGVW
jgi:hypothetical protein